jgi:translation initiation factor IF-3
MQEVDIAKLYDADPVRGGPRVNREIVARSVRVVGADGEMIGIMSLREAFDAAADAELDLVEIAPTADPPVCKILDYGKFRFEEQKKANLARKNQKIVELKEIKLRPGIDDNDYDVKMRAATRFVEEGDKVKLTMRFRGREMAHQDLGLKVLIRVRDQLQDIAKVEQMPRVEGRMMVMVIAPR